MQLLNSFNLKKSINLIYPPASLPTSPYSSLPYLKGGLDDSGVEVVCFDLNVEAYNYWFSEDYTNSISLASELQNAKSFLKGNKQNFLNKAKYKTVNKTITSYFDKINSKLNHQSLSFGGYLYKGFTFTLSNIIKLSKDKNDPISNYYINYFSGKKFNSNYFGISITYDFQLIPSLLLAYFIKQKTPSSKVIFGGASILYLKQFFLANKWIFKLIDLIIIGDGVLPISKYLSGDNIINNCIKLDRKNSVYYNYSGDEIDFNSMESPDYSCLPLDKYFSPCLNGIVLTSLGCYYGKCAFCIPSKGKNFKYQIRSIEKLKMDIAKTTKALNSSLIFFGDDSININHIKKLLASLNDIVHWQGEFRFERNLDKNTLDFFSTNGCLQILLGLESASQRVSDLMNKGIDFNIVTQILNDSYSANVLTNIQTIIGFPTETIEEAYKTASFLFNQKEKINSCAVSSFTLYQGSDVYKHPKNYKIKIIKDDFVSEYEVASGINKSQSIKLSNSIYKSISDYLPVNDFFLDGPMGNHAMIYYKHNIKI